MDGFDITAASEIMAILCLSKDLNDLKRRLGNIVIGYDSNGKEYVDVSSGLWNVFLGYNKISI